MSTKVRTPRGRVSYPCVFEARAIEDGQEAKFSCSLIFPAGTDFSAMTAAVTAAAVARWGKVPPNAKLPWLKGEDQMRDDGSRIDGYEDGSIFIRTTSKSRPGVIGRQKDAAGKWMTLDSEDDFYAGCYAHAVVNAFAWETKTGKGISFGLLSIQKLVDGEPFGMKSDPEADFADVDEETDAELVGEGDLLG